MAVNLYDAVNLNGLFNVLGKLFKAQSDMNVSRGTTIPTDILNAITYFDKITSNSVLTQGFAPVPTAIPQYQGGAGGAIGILQQAAQALTIGMVGNDKTQPDNTLKTALQYIITQMLGAGASVNKSTVTVSVAAGGGNTGNGVLLKSIKRGDGLIQESMLAESIAGTFSGSGLTASLQLQGQQAPSGALGQDWPSGSGVARGISSVDANASSILTNGGMENFTIAANVPDNWIPAVATPGTTLLATIVEQQQIVIAGTPTGGTFPLSWVNPAGKTQTTVQIPYNAAASTIQSALRALTGLQNVTVVNTAGSPPNQTLLVTFTGQGGALNLMTSSTAFLTGGAPTITITHATVGTAQVFAGGQAVQYKSNGAELTELRQLLPQSQLTPKTAYAISLWACVDAVAAAGVITVDLFDGSAVINDAQGSPNSITFNATALTTAFQHLSALQAAECVFRLPAVVPPVVYLRIRISTAVTNTKSMFVDQVGLTPMTEIYSGGPLLALFSGNTAWAAADTFTVTTTNDRAGVLREWCERNFGMAALGLIFPTSATPTIPDSVVS